MLDKFISTMRKDRDSEMWRVVLESYYRISKWATVKLGGLVFTVVLAWWNTTSVVLTNVLGDLWIMLAGAAGIAGCNTVALMMILHVRLYETFKQEPRRWFAAASLRWPALGHIDRWNSHALLATICLLASLNIPDMVEPVQWLMAHRVQIQQGMLCERGHLPNTVPSCSANKSLAPAQLEKHGDPASSIRSI